jgi:Flp pilus assembly protein TadD
LLLAEKASVASPERVQSDGLRKQASILLETKRYAEAISYAKRALELFPDDPRPYVQIAYAMARAKNKEAPDWARKAIAKEPTNPLWYGALSDTFRFLGKWKEAVEPMSKAVAMTPENWQFQSFLGLCLMNSKKFDEALPHLKRALELNPRDPRTYQRLGLVLIRTHRGDEGEQYIRKALELAPDDPDIQASFGWHMLLRGKRKEANEAFREALRLNPQMILPKVGLADPEGEKRGLKDRLLWVSIRLATIPPRVPLLLFHFILLELTVIYLLLAYLNDYVQLLQLSPLVIAVASWCFFFVIQPFIVKVVAKRRGAHFI